MVDERALDPRALERLVATARAAAAAASDVALAWLDRSGRLEVEEKAASDDLVSQADREAERAARSVLAVQAPGDPVLGEESGEHEADGAVRWLVDPIDGTTNYLYGRPDWAVSVAAIGAEDGRVLAAAVVEPALGLTTTARRGGGAWRDGRQLACRPATDLSRALIELNLGLPAQRPLAGRLIEALVGRVRDVRRGGSAAAALAQVADGRAEAYWGPGLQPWDGAAGALLVAEAGGVVGDLDGPTDAPWPDSGDVLAAPGGLWEPLRELLAGVYAGHETPNPGG
jgi:myo-inositol-1(or 4)-monophosphatase